MDYLDTFSHFATGINYEALGSDIHEQVGWILADTIGAMTAGSAEPELRKLASRQTSGQTAVLVGLGCHATTEVAAFINGTSGTFLEMDEGNRFSRGHPAVHVIPAVLALSQERAVKAPVFLSALVTGYEVGSRLGAASVLRGAMHPHGTWGTLGAAAACARIAGLDAAGMRETLNISSSLTTASSKQTMLEGGLVRNVYAGLSNRNGLLALQLTECGFTGESDGLSSLLGKIISEKFDSSSLVQNLGSQWHLMCNYFKLHSCCRYNHGALDAIDQLASAGALPTPGNIARIDVTTYNLAAELNDKAPRNTLAAKFSLPFAVATRLVNQSSALSSFTWDAVRDPAVLALAQKVEVSEDPAMTQRLPLERPARVLITLHDGLQLSAEAGVNRGDDAAPYSREELRQKFMELTQRVWPAGHAQAVLEATLELAALRGSLTTWATLLERAPQTA
ncbi:MAG: MmgE/PrpD family protein [Burkholderiaceae bacterium]